MSRIIIQSPQTPTSSPRPVVRPGTPFNKRGMQSPMQSPSQSPIQNMTSPGLSHIQHGISSPSLSPIRSPMPIPRAKKMSLVAKRKATDLPKLPPLVPIKPQSFGGRVSRQKKDIDELKKKRAEQINEKRIK
jgi:hypothetical protein